MSSSAPKITVYSKSTCGYCRQTKRLLSSKGVDVEEIDIGADPSRRAEMIERSQGGYTVPQIFIGDTHVGGNSDLQALEARGRLDPLLQGGA